MRKVALMIFALVSLFSASSFGQEAAEELVKNLDRQQQEVCPRQADPFACKIEFTTAKILASSLMGNALIIGFKQGRKEISQVDADQALKQNIDKLKTHLADLQKYK